MAMICADFQLMPITFSLFYPSMITAALRYNEKHFTVDYHTCSCRNVSYNPVDNGRSL